jgi:hypothetical protein
MKSITLDVPDHVLAYYEKLAHETQSSLKTLLEERLADTSDVLDDYLTALDNYPEKQLWDVVQARLSAEQNSRLADFQARLGELSPQEKQENKRLVQLVEEQMLLRSRALWLLKQKGHDVSAYFKSNS